MGWLFRDSNKREDNHGKWEQRDPKGAIKAKARGAQIARENEQRERKRREQAAAELARHTRPRRRRGWSWLWPSGVCGRQTPIRPGAAARRIRIISGLMSTSAT